MACKEEAFHLTMVTIKKFIVWAFKEAFRRLVPGVHTFRLLQALGCNVNEEDKKTGSNTLRFLVFGRMFARVIW